jgi:hypothetical protein
LAFLCGGIDGILDENSAEYVRNLLVKAAATIEKLQSQPSPETTDHPPATGEQESKGSTVSLNDPGMKHPKTVLHHGPY